jgi:hypothetical protein
MNAMRMVLALALSSSCLYAAQSQAMIVLSNGQTQVVWHVGDPDPSIDENVQWFSAAVCGPELTWGEPALPGSSDAHADPRAGCKRLRHLSR